jgi:hypothetical protein
MDLLKYGKIIKVFQILLFDEKAFLVYPRDLWTEN